MTETKSLDIDLSFKKNNVDELFLNLSENPEGFKNKDFRFTLSLIYQLIEDEFAGIFLSPNSPVRNTDFFLINEAGKLSFFVTPTNNFQFYLKSKGSMFRFSPKELNGEIGYIMPLDIVLDYFGGFGDIIDFSAVSQTFVYFNKLTQFVMKLVEKLYFIPTVKNRGNFFRIVYEPIVQNQQIARIINELEECLPDNLFIKGERPKNFVSDFVHDYLNYVVYKFLHIKSYRFKDVKTGSYLLKDLEQKSLLKGKDVAENFAQWFDELYLGKYDVIPFFQINKIENSEDFELKIHIKNRKNNESILMDELYVKDTVWDANSSDIARIIEKQLNFALRYMPELEKLFEDEEKLALRLNLSEVYKIIAQTSYYLQKAQIEVILPEELTNIIVPRASINARVKEKRSDDLMNIFNTVSSTSISLDDILEFSYEVSLGDEKISLEDFNKLVEKNSGLVKYHDKYVLIDKEEGKKLAEQILNANHKKMTRLQLLHASMSGRIQDYDFNYDEAYANVIKDFARAVDVEPPNNLKGTLRPYQQTGLKWLWTNVSKGFGCCMADDMGLGKTLQALTVLQKAKEEDGPMPTLVIAPTTVVFNWESEIQKFAPSLSCLKLQGGERKQFFDKIPEYDVVITSYALLRRDIKKLKDINFRYVILDESQNIKNATSQTAQAVKQLTSQHKLALSGTPIENKLEELWSVFDFLMPGFLFTMADFNSRYVNPIMEHQDKVVEKRLKLQIYPFILRRMKRDVAKDLPDKVENIAYCELTDDQRDFYLQVLDSTKEELFKSIEQNGLEKSRLSIFSALLRMRQICCHPRLYDKNNVKNVISSGKFEKLKVMLEEIISEKHRILLFSQFVDMLDIVKAWLDKSGIKYEYLTGKTKDRQGAVERFNTDPTIPIFLISLKAGGTGLNLTGADYVIHYDPWWNPAVEDQATDRAYRIGQTKKVFVYRLITKNTVEEKIQKLKTIKRNLVDSVISVDRNITKSLTMDDIREIFSVD